MIVIASFGLFALNQTSTASKHQEQVLAAPGSAAGASGSPAPATKPSSEGTVHRTIDEASEWLTSPFDGLTSGSSSQWAIHAVGLVLALLVYGFGVGFVARALRVRT
jgi:hypothetical protein